MKWLRDASKHVSAVEETLLKHYRIQRGLLDGLWAYVGNKGEKKKPETPESGQFLCSTMLDMDSRFRVAGALEKDGTQASIGVFQMLKRRGHPNGPPATISDGWGGIDQAMVEVYGLVPEYTGRGRPPTRKKRGTDWLYLQMVKQRYQTGHFAGTKLKVVFGNKDKVIQLLGKSTAYIECSNLTSRLFNGRQVRKTLGFSKDVDCYRFAAIWEDAYYNLVKPHKSLRLRIHDVPGCKWQPRTPAMVANLTDHIWTVTELSTIVPFRC